MAHQGRARANEFVPLERANALFEAVDAHAQQIMQAEVAAVEDEDDEPMNSPIFQYLSANNAFGTFTHLTADKIEAIWRPVNAIMAAQRHRGPNSILNFSNGPYPLVLDMAQDWTRLCYHCQGLQDE